MGDRRIKICPEHHKPFSEKSPNKGGFFWHVINFANREYHSITKEEYNALPDPSEEGIGPKTSQTEPTREPVEGRDYEGENKGKVRHGLMVAIIQHDGLDKIITPTGVVSSQVKEDINQIVDFIMTGK